MDCHLARRDAGTQVNAHGAPCRIVALNTFERRYTMFQHEAMRDEWQKEEPMIEQLPFLVTAFAKHMRETNRTAAESGASDPATRPHRDIGPIGTAARLVVGL